MDAVQGKQEAGAEGGLQEDLWVGELVLPVGIVTLRRPVKNWRIRLDNPLEPM